MSENLNHDVLDCHSDFGIFTEDGTSAALSEASDGQLDYTAYSDTAAVAEYTSQRAIAQADIIHCPVTETAPEAPLAALGNISAFQAAIKRGFDIAAALAALIVLAPTWLAITAILAFQNGPILFAQERIGKGGRMFRCYKFRTMKVDADALLAQLLASDPARRAEWNANRKLAEDPRATTLGKFLRLSSLDEIPQLLNILKGDMSVVGPRPIVRKEIVKYNGFYPYYLSVTPGLTGLWQVSGRNSTTYARRVALDVSYVNNFSLGQDVKIIALTIPALFRTDEVS